MSFKSSESFFLCVVFILKHSPLKSHDCLCLLKFKDHFSPSGVSFHVTSYLVFFSLHSDTFSKISTLLFTFWTGCTINYHKTTPEWSSLSGLQHFSAEVFMRWAENSACLFWKCGVQDECNRVGEEMENLDRWFYHKVASGSSVCFKSKYVIKHEQNWFCAVTVILLVVVFNVRDVLAETEEHGVYRSLWHST